MDNEKNDNQNKWYHGITRYQWLILIIACAGWIFDVYEGQIFNITRGEMLNDLLSGLRIMRQRRRQLRNGVIGSLLHFC